VKTHHLVLSAALLFNILLTAAHAAERPNVLVIMTDDQARWAVGAYGNSECRTPNMDRLARDGARFTNAFVVTPVCSPSRASFFTGRYGTELRITDWINKPEADAGIGLLTTAFAFIPLLLPLHGIVRGSTKWLRAAPMALAPALALAITEILVNPASRPFAGVTLALAFLAFAAIVAALRSRAPG